MIEKQEEAPKCGKCGKTKIKHEILSLLCDSCDPESLLNKAKKGIKRLEVKNETK